MSQDFGQVCFEGTTMIYVNSCVVSVCVCFIPTAKKSFFRVFNLFGGYNCPKNEEVQKLKNTYPFKTDFLE